MSALPLGGPSGARALFSNKPLFRLASASLTITDADPDQNDVFNTNLGAINVQQAMVIHRLQIQCNFGTVLPGGDATALLVGILSENTGATSAVLQGNDSRTLFLYQRDFAKDFSTAVGSTLNVYNAIQTVDLDPWPIWTIAQQLNFLGELTEGIAAAYPDFIMRIHLWYTLEPVDATLRSRLLERLNLAL